MLVSTNAEVEASQIGALQGLKTLHVTTSQVPAMFLEVLPSGLRDLVVHRISGFVQLNLLARLKDLERVDITTTKHGSICLDASRQLHRLREMRLTCPCHSINVNGRGWGDRLDVLALHGRVVTIDALRPVRCMSVSAHTLHHNFDFATTPEWKSSIQHLRILVDDPYFSYSYKELINLQTLECTCLVIPSDLVSLRSVHNVTVANDAPLPVFEDLGAECGGSRATTWAVANLTPFESRSYRDRCWNPPA